MGKSQQGWKLSTEPATGVSDGLRIGFDAWFGVALFGSEAL
jgi:hypothetical protein